MELFLLLSLGMSAMVFMSVALNESPNTQALSDHHLEPAFPLEPSIINIESHKDHTLEVEGMPRKIIRLPEEHLISAERLTAATA